MTWSGRIGLLVLPPIAYSLTYRLCLGLQRHDREVLEHGIETGAIKMLPSGEFIEAHQPLGPEPLPYAGVPVPKRMNALGVAAPLRRVRGFFYPVREASAVEEELQELAELIGSGDDRAGADR
jgi:ubiquinol-cytochrome c reductase cytochrome b subunit